MEKKRDFKFSKLLIFFKEKVFWQIVSDEINIFDNFFFGLIS